MRFLPLMLAAACFTAAVSARTTITPMPRSNSTVPTVYGLAAFTSSLRAQSTRISASHAGRRGFFA